MPYVTIVAFPGFGTRATTVPLQAPPSHDSYVTGFRHQSDRGGTSGDQAAARAVAIALKAKLETEWRRADVATTALLTATSRR